MFPDSTLTLAAQIVWTVEDLLKVLAVEAGKLRTPGLLARALWSRVRRFERRFGALYAQWKAGTLPKARVRKGSSPQPSPQRGEGEGLAGDPVVSRPASLLPRGVGWMYKTLPASAAAFRSMLEPLIGELPEMKAFVSEVPQAGRLLRPMCRMVGIKPPVWLALPRRRRAGAAADPPRPLVRSAAQPPARGEGEGKRRRRTAREIAAAAIAKSLRTGKPVDPRKVSPVVFGYVLHWPRDEHCPPPEIGYGGRAFPNTPKDYKPPKDEG
jgi:hypothetical protein